MIPQGVIEIRLSLCTLCSDKAGDPCAACEHGKWGPYVRCEEPLPPVTVQAQNFLKAAFEEGKALISSKPPTPEEISRRLEICRACEHYRASDERCAKCGCFLRIKTAWRAQKCPIGKW